MMWLIAVVANELWFMGLGIFAFNVLSFCAWMTTSRSLRWPVVDGIVVGHGVAEISEGKARPCVLFRYEVAGVSHQADRVTYDGFKQSRPEVTAVLEKYPVGSQVSVYHHPTRHSFAVLEPGPKGGAAFCVALGLIFLVLWLWIIRTENH